MDLNELNKKSEQNLEWKNPIPIGQKVPSRSDHHTLLSTILGFYVGQSLF